MRSFVLGRVSRSLVTLAGVAVVGASCSSVLPSLGSGLDGALVVGITSCPFIGPQPGQPLASPAVALVVHRLGDGSFTRPTIAGDSYWFSLLAGSYVISEPGVRRSLSVRVEVQPKETTAANVPCR